VKRKQGATEKQEQLPAGVCAENACTMNAPREQSSSSTWATVVTCVAAGSTGGAGSSSTGSDQHPQRWDGSGSSVGGMSAGGTSNSGGAGTKVGRREELSEWVAAGAAGRWLSDGRHTGD
jgi:hypothetical protein